MADSLSGLVSRLRAAGAEPSARELADALWLARWSRPREPLAPAGDPGTRTDGAGNAVSAAGGTHRATQQRDGAAESGPGGERRPGDGDGTVPLHTAAPPSSGSAGGSGAHSGTGPGPEEGAGRVRGGAGVPVRAPVAHALPSLLPLQRALRPLRSYHPPVRAQRMEIDEQATAERAAETGLVLPVPRSGPRRTARVRLLMDVSSSMRPWEEMCEELRQACAGAGAFRDVTVHFLHEDTTSGDPAVGSGMDARAGALRPAGQLRDPTGHWITLLLSDCAGPMWRSGTMQRQLSRWAQTAPVAVVQPLPQRMWRRTHLPALPGALSRRQGLGGQLVFRPAGGAGRRGVHGAGSPGHGAGRSGGPAGTGRPGGGDGAWPVPVLSPTEEALGSWARLVSGATGVAVNAAAGWVRSAHPASTAPRGRGTRDPQGLLAAFETGASPDAVRLAVFLSASELVLPVMQLVQRAMLPHTGPSDLAEVLLSGLLRREEPRGPAAGPVAYEFHDGVRELLLQRMDLGDAKLVLQECSRYVERNFGRRARNFPAMAVAYLGGTVGPGGAAGPGDGAHSSGAPATQPFARVSQAVLRRFLPRGPEQPLPGPERPEELRRQADAHWARYRDDGTVRELEAAVARFRRMGTPEADAPLARALLERWRVVGDRDDLEGAYEAARRAAEADADEASELLTRALVALAEEVRTAGPWDTLPVVAQFDGPQWRTPGEQRLFTEYMLLYSANLVGPGSYGDASARAARAEVLLRMAEVDDRIDRPRSKVPGSGHSRVRNHLWDALDLLADADDARQLRARGRARLLLSRYYASAGVARRDRAAEHAERARNDLRHARLLLADEDSWPPEEWARYWLDRAEATTRAAHGAHDGEHFRIVHEEARAALRHAEESDDPELRAETVVTLAEHCVHHWTESGSEEHLPETVTLLRQTRIRHPEAGAGRLRHLEAQLQLAVGRGRQDTGRITEGIRLLRECQAEAESPAELASLEAELGAALLSRFRTRDAAARRWADVEEAEAVFSSVTRSREADVDSAVNAWAALAGLWLTERTDAPRYRRAHEAARCLHHAARTAEENGRMPEAAAFRWQRADMLLEWLGTAPAVTAYQGVAELWERNGQPEHDDVRRARDRIRTLRSGEA